MLSTFLGLPAKSIGRVGGGRTRATGLLDVALIQSLVKKGVVHDLVADYGHVIVDECHHLSAQTFKSVVRQAKARFVVRLSATVARKDGHHPIVTMQCGPVRYRVNARAQAAARPFEHVVLVQPTGFRSKRAPDPDRRVEFLALYQELVADTTRNRRIADDVLDAVNSGRSPLVLANLFVHAVRPVSGDTDGLARARSATEAFLFKRFESLPETKGRFALNTPLPIAFDGAGTLEVDLLCVDARLAVELDGAQHLSDPVAYRRDRRKDQLLQENGYFVLRFLAEDVGKELDTVLDAILRALSHRRT